ncbi:MAG: hypothetical protein LBG15_00860 [Dysgonamonadaceae bacterium]|jgi:uncharacterized protein (TIGR02646 family)|nr:hypothetical protein [Dysgonamonadaceae bacterium]
MIKISKSAQAPAILTTKGASETIKLKNTYEANPTQYTSGIAKMTFDSAIYGNSTVKQQLIAEQYGKCCFCESLFVENSFGDVEHFRPKAAYKKKGDKKLTYPGYYWLAYDWNNLIFSCEKCNRTYKKNEFPLKDEATRKSNHAHSNPLDKEDRLLINPVEEDPSLFITFREEIPVAVNGNAKGATSIKIFGLERLNESRLEHLNLLKCILPLASIDENNTVDVDNAARLLKITSEDVVETVKQAKILYHSAAKASAKFAYCVRCKFAYLPTV